MEIIYEFNTENLMLFCGCTCDFGYNSAYFFSEKT